MLWELAVPAVIWVVLGRASISGFLPSNASGSLKKDCFPGEPEPHTWIDKTPTTTATWAVPGEAEE